LLAVSVTDAIGFPLLDSSRKPLTVSGFKSLKRRDSNQAEHGFPARIEISIGSKSSPFSPKIESSVLERFPL
jgi:hypothetical protein